jgi:hypothetical protein
MNNEVNDFKSVLVGAFSFFAGSYLTTKLGYTSTLSKVIGGSITSAISYIVINKKKNNKSKHVRFI